MSETLFDGGQEASTDNNRVIQFDQYPAEIMSQVKVYKTGEASLVGGAIATVDLDTIRPLDYDKTIIPTAGGVLCRRNRGPRRANLLVGVVSGGPPAFRFCLFLPLSVLAVVCSPPGAPSIAPLSHAMGGSDTARTTTFVFAWKGPTARSIAAWGAAPGSGPPQACGLKAHAIAAASRTRLKIFPRFPQQIRVSSPSTPQNPLTTPTKPHIHLKSWHSSYAPLATINIWIKSIEGQL